MRISRYDPRWVAPFGDPRIKAWLAAPRGLSQLPHVLRRLLKPRHPPDTLSSLGNFLFEVSAPSGLRPPAWIPPFIEKSPRRFREFSVARLAKSILCLR